MKSNCHLTNAPTQFNVPHTPVKIKAFANLRIMYGEQDVGRPYR